MGTATMHIAEVGGYAGRARCFAIDPPYEGHHYATVCVVPALGAVTRPEAMTFPAGETGACAELSLKRRPGSYVLHDTVQTDEQFDGACALALLMLGGYTIGPQDAP
jgi:hypothetical protein